VHENTGDKQEVEMTNHLQDPRVLSACGWEREQFCWRRGKEWLSSAGFPVLSLSDLWPALCRVCETRDIRVVARMCKQVEVHNGEVCEICQTSKYGSFENAIAAAIVWVMENCEVAYE
jgi:hypothetical protein